MSGDVLGQTEIVIMLTSSSLGLLVTLGYAVSLKYYPPLSSRMRFYNTLLLTSSVIWHLSRLVNESKGTNIWYLRYIFKWLSCILMCMILQLQFVLLEAFCSLSHFLTLKKLYIGRFLVLLVFLGTVSPLFFIDLFALGDDRPAWYSMVFPFNTVE